MRRRVLKVGVLPDAVRVWESSPHARANICCLVKVRRRRPRPRKATVQLASAARRF